MSAARIVSRAAFRQSRFVIQRRAESTTSKVAESASSTASKAKEGASEYAGKAQQGLSRVTSSAGSAASSAASAASNAVSGIGGRTGQAISFVQSLIPPTIYYARVAGELAKIVAKNRNMQFPSQQTIQSYMTPLHNAIKNPSAAFSRTSASAQSVAQQGARKGEQAVQNPQSIMTQLRNFDSQTALSAGVVLAEVLGFFTVGEMIGRFKIVGYRSEHGEHH
ncbi:hypothetical protein EJ03DRAFT_354831 [Teratosphaeria nubilosa]|uniref:Mitochondrial F1F0-ATP synthase g subunit n=1 Tax=Teratosphaeria nubilosa TaxID=161662 RepID=A0A6G1KXT8_9PEZI|nr:hypothetical protein EJ03DRAFT_354831 [Teratosphaeria nubilosa]